MTIEQPLFCVGNRVTVSESDDGYSGESGTVLDRQTQIYDYWVRFDDGNECPFFESELTAAN